MPNLSLPVLIFFVILYGICIFCAIKPDIIVNLTAKYFKFAGKIFGKDSDVQATEKAKRVVRTWNIFLLILMTFILFTARF